MRPVARLASAIELIDLIETEITQSGVPMDRIIQGYFRTRRYAGSKDRRAVSDMVYALYRIPPAPPMLHAIWPGIDPHREIPWSRTMAATRCAR